MFKIKCPKCQVGIKGMARDYIQWRSDRRECPCCKTQLVISNGAVCFGLCGFLFGVLIGGSNFWVFGNEWVRLATVILICWAIMPIIVRIVGRWRVLPGDCADSAGVRWWSNVAYISGWVIAIALGITCSSAALYWKYLRDLSTTDPTVDVERVESWFAAMRVYLLGGFGIILAAVVVNIFALMMRRRTAGESKKVKGKDKKRWI